MRALVTSIPGRYRFPLLERARPPFFAGKLYGCPCCQRTFRRLMGFRGVANVRCPGCGSMNRHRLLWLYLHTRTPLLTQSARMLHVAPEYPLWRTFRRMAHLQYTSADLMSNLANVHADLQHLPFGEDSFDIVICNHVLEHVDDDAQAMAEIRRVLAPRGWAILMHPVDRTRETTLEDGAGRSPEERMELYGQEDHARLYGNDFPARLRAQGLDVLEDRFYDELPADIVRRYCLKSEHPIFEEDTIWCVK